MSTVNEWLVSKGYAQYVWAFAMQGLEGPECLRNLASLSEADLSKLAVSTIRKAEEALGVSKPEPASAGRRLTSAAPGLRVEIDKTRTGRQKGKTFVEYAVDVYTVDRQHVSQSWHRFSDFIELGKQVAGTSPEDQAGLPKPPSKNTAGKAKDSVIQDRKSQLAVYVGRLLVACPSRGRAILDNFLEISNAELDPIPVRSAALRAPARAEAPRSPARAATEENADAEGAFNAAGGSSVGLVLGERASVSR